MDDMARCMSSKWQHSCSQGPSTKLKNFDWLQMWIELGLLMTWFSGRLREQDVWKTCFIQLKYKKNGGTIRRSSQTHVSGDFNLFKYFKSFRGIKKNDATDRNLKQCGPFDDFEFVIYTNQKLKTKSPTQESESPPHVVDSEPLSILISGTDYGKYITFDDTRDTDIFGFFEELSNIINLLKNWTVSLNLELLWITQLTKR